MRIMPYEIRGIAVANFATTEFETSFRVKCRLKPAATRGGFMNNIFFEREAK